MDIYHFGNHLHENTENQQQINIQSADVLGLLVFGGLFLILKKNSLRKLALFLVFIIFKFKLWNAPFPQMIKIAKRYCFHHSGKKNLDCKNPGFLAQCHTIPAISLCKTLAHSNKVSVWDGISKVCVRSFSCFVIDFPICNRGEFSKSELRSIDNLKC